MQLNKTALGLALGVCWGASIVLTTLWLGVTGGGETLVEFLGKFYIGYSVSIFGAIAGFVYGFIDGFIYGFLLAWIYNSLAGRLTSS
jgi:hypothetical protein